MIRHTGQRVVIREHAPKARDFTNRRYRHRGVVDEVERAKNRTKSKVRARVGSYWAAKGRNVSATRPTTVQPPQ
jgi:IS5 family transposase